MMHVEMIIDYVTDGTDFQYFDNTGILVRCRDCKNYDHGCTRYDAPIDPDDFCSYGERKEEE